MSSDRDDADAHAEARESDWLLARDDDGNAPPPSAALAGEYAELEQMLAHWPTSTEDTSWHDDVLRAAQVAPRASRSTSRRRKIMRWAPAVAMMAAAAIALVVLIPRPARELELAFERPAAAPGTQKRVGIDEIATGDHLYVTARIRDAGDLRVYRADGVLVARCPGDAGCRTTEDHALILEVALVAPVEHFIILAIGLHDAPRAWAMDRFLEAARMANARVVRLPSFVVH